VRAEELKVLAAEKQNIMLYGMSYKLY